jgi:translation initiation factor IF-3
VDFGSPVLFYCLLSESLEVNVIAKEELRINEAIRAREVRVNTADGEQLGIMSLRDALHLAEEKHQDLVEIAPKAKPPVCRIMDYGKYLYEQQKREKEARKRQRIIDVKEVKLRIRIEDHDFDVKTKNAIRFLQGGDKVKVTIMFRGREMTHPELGEQLLNRMADQLQEIATVERKPKLEGRNMIMIVAPKSSK